ncbi:hypothetical protein CYQ65_11570 [Enterococcus faecium]|nr:hypothetical protein CKY07_01125 [Enterococcus faecium]RXW79791.1 hypothetical protein CYQ65_11570 [Enterococcus faecium]TKO02296.1 hypothetical protein DVX93_13135 [Enterococcus faecium]
MVLNNFLKEGFILSYLIVCLIIIICLHHLFLSKTIPRYSKNKKAEKFCLLLPVVLVNFFLEENV